HEAVDEESKATTIKTTASSLTLASSSTATPSPPPTSKPSLPEQLSRRHLVDALARHAEDFDPATSPWSYRAIDAGNAGGVKCVGVAVLAAREVDALPVDAMDLYAVEDDGGHDVPAGVIQCVVEGKQGRCVGGGGVPGFEKHMRARMPVRKCWWECWSGELEGAGRVRRRWASSSTLSREQQELKRQLEGLLKTLTPFTFPKTDVTIQYSRSSGPGGQNVNKVNSKVDLRYNLSSTTLLPPPIVNRLRQAHANTHRMDRRDNLVVMSDRHRTQAKNERDCFEKLHAMVVEAVEEVMPRETPPETVERIEMLAEVEKERKMRSKMKRSGVKEERRRGRFDD
ncbi:hypothetical protein HK101_011316, partial [Irineochytrium annulatum]